MERIYIKPANAGAIVRHPEKLSYIIPADGEWVNDSTQWQRYIIAGDVVIAEPPVKQTENKPKGGDK